MTSRTLQAAAWTTICVAAAGAVWYGTTWGVGLSPDSAAYIAGARRLLSPSGMGDRFKVLAARSPHLPPLPGLTA